MTPPQSRWISAAPTGPNGLYTYEFCWCMDDSFSNPEFSIQARADECDRLIELAESHRIFLADAVEGIASELARVRDQFTKKLDENAQGAAGAFNAVDEALKTSDAAPRKKKCGLILGIYLRGPRNTKKAAVTTTRKYFRGIYLIATTYPPPITPVPTN